MVRCVARACHMTAARLIEPAGAEGHRASVPFDGDVAGAHVLIESVGDVLRLLASLQDFERRRALDLVNRVAQHLRQELYVERPCVKGLRLPPLSHLLAEAPDDLSHVAGP